ncbi:hypothetical protein NQ318_000921 [Aromia moschata]|uniref:Uncharacterized protein n=1 Tax=Aromia moschata TaxID=1265417 RepID=A0AAV8ZF38_9CUCU|nr:hypothetical protein NQ318_000921 [Aromia moschata]
MKEILVIFLMFYSFLMYDQTCDNILVSDFSPQDCVNKQTEESSYYYWVDETSCLPYCAAYTADVIHHSVNFGNLCYNAGLDTIKLYDNESINRIFKRLVNYIRISYPCITTPLTDPSRCPGTHVCSVIRQSHAGTLDRQIHTLCDL